MHRAQITWFPRIHSNLISPPFHSPTGQARGTLPFGLLELKGKTVIVTGSGSNIGRGIALAFAREGSNVVMFEIDRDRGQKVADEAKQAGAKEVLLLQVDVTDVGQVKKAVDQTLQRFKAIDVLVDNVGGTDWKPFMDESLESIDKIIRLNLWSTIHCLHAVLPHMISKKAGVVVNISSGSGVQPVAGITPYSLAKAGVIGLTQALARELGPQGIRLNCVAPGAITPTTVDYRNRHLQLPARLKDLEQRACIKRIGTPEDIADATVFLASNRSSYIIGQTLSVDGGQYFH